MTQKDKIRKENIELEIHFRCLLPTSSSVLAKLHQVTNPRPGSIQRLQSNVSHIGEDEIQMTCYLDLTFQRYLWNRLMNSPQDQNLQFVAKDFARDIIERWDVVDIQFNVQNTQFKTILRNYPQIR